MSLCRQAATTSPKAFWALKRLGYCQVHLKQWSQAVQSLQNAIRGYPTCADLWEILGLAYQRLGMLTAALKSYGRAIELVSSRVFALVESGNILLMLGSFRKGIEHFRLALQISPQNAAAHFGLASGLLALSKECIGSGAFGWGAMLLEEASIVANASTCLVGNASCAWKLHGDIQVAYAKCFPWTDEPRRLKTFETFRASIFTWRQKCLMAATSASRSYQRALHLTPWQANIYIDIAISVDLICTLEETSSQDVWQLPSKISLGGLLLEEENSDFWVALGCLSGYSALKQHALIRSLQLDVSLAVAWAYLGKLYRTEGEKILTTQAFDHARSIDPSLALPWAGMSADTHSSGITHAEAYESCLRAAQILPVFGAIRQAVQRAPQFPELHNLNGMISEARSDYQSAVASYRLAKFAINTSDLGAPKSKLSDISVNLARALCCLLDSKGLQIYGVSLWQNGKSDQALSVARSLAANVSTIDRPTAATSISLIFKLLYRISGQDITVTSILKMPKELLINPKISFVVTVLDTLDHSNQLKLVLSTSRDSLTSHEDISGMHSLIALCKLIRHGTAQSLGSQSGIEHLKKALHIYPSSISIRNQLGSLLLHSKEWKDIHSATRCVVTDPPCSGHLLQPVETLKSAREVIGACGIGCYDIGTTYPRFSFATCNDQFMHGAKLIQKLQRWLHQEPWNQNARYLLILNVVQKAREERYPRHLCNMIARLVCSALSSELFSGYQRFQFLLCASEISLQTRDYLGCINHATAASLLPDNEVFFSHLLLCRAYGAQGDFSKVRQEYKKCLDLETDYPTGWICLKSLEHMYGLKEDVLLLASKFEECLGTRSRRGCRNVWMCTFELVGGPDPQSCVSHLSEIMKTCDDSIGDNCLSCLLLYHGAMCMQLARKNYSAEILGIAERSLSRAQAASIIPLPFVSALVAQVEASLMGSRDGWEANMRLEWFSWPPEMRLAEVYFQMHLVARHRKTTASSSSSHPVDRQTPKKWILRALHLNPSCCRYWKLLLKSSPVLEDYH
ncbi:hypothetical protein ACHQM5_022625 [Ranunculus cassubicifolius]